MVLSERGELTIAQHQILGEEGHLISWASFSFSSGKRISYLEKNKRRRMQDSIHKVVTGQKLTLHHVVSISYFAMGLEVRVAPR